jgi:Methylase of polypeptide chain release factors
VDKYVTVSEILKKNLKKYNVSNAQFILSNWLHAIAPNSIDIIVANPPYVDYNCPDADQSVKLHEPQTALFSCAGGYEDL